MVFLRTFDLQPICLVMATIRQGFNGKRLRPRLLPLAQIGKMFVMFPEGAMSRERLSTAGAFEKAFWMDLQYFFGE